MFFRFVDLLQTGQIPRHDFPKEARASQDPHVQAVVETESVPSLRVDERPVPEPASSLRRVGKDGADANS